MCPPRPTHIIFVFAVAFFANGVSTRKASESCAEDTRITRAQVVPGEFSFSVPGQRDRQTVAARPSSPHSYMFINTHRLNWAEPNRYHREINLPPGTRQRAAFYRRCDAIVRKRMGRPCANCARKAGRPWANRARGTTTTRTERRGQGGLTIRSQKNKKSITNMMRYSMEPLSPEVP